MSASIIEERLEALHGAFVSFICGVPIKNPKLIEDSTGGKIDPNNGETIETAKVITTVLAHLRDETASGKKRGPGRGRKKASAQASTDEAVTKPKRRGRRKKAVEEDDE